MTSRALKFVRLTAVVCLALTGVYATAAQVTSQDRGSYQRLNFNFGQPANLKVDTRGNVIALQFDMPLKKSSGEIQNLLKGYATGVDVSADGRSMTLTMNKQYRVRQFKSGPIIGMDIIGTPSQKPDAPEAKTIAAPEPVQQEATDETLTTKPLSLGTLPPAPSKKEEKKPVAKKTEVKSTPEKAAPKNLVAEPKPPLVIPSVTPVKAETSMLSTKPATLTTTPSPAPATEKPVVADTKPLPVPEKKPETLISTKSETPPAPLVPVVKPVDSKPEQPPIAEVRPAPELKKDVVAPTPVPEHAPSDAHKAIASADEEKFSNTGDFVVTARTKSEKTTINFPYQKRTALAVFERGRDIWVIFSTAENVNVSLLRSVLPKAVIDVTQYGNAGYTILKLTTDGTVHATSQPVADTYAWNIVLAPSATAPTMDIPVSVDMTDNNSRLLFGAFDVSESLQFYDPSVGDLLVVVPSYEAGRGVVNARNFPEIDVLPSNQGIAIASQVEKIHVNASRLGVAIETPEGLAVSKNLFVQTVRAGLASGNASVLLPYDQWFVPPTKFRSVLSQRLQALAYGTNDARSQHLFSLATLYLGQGFGTEALGYLQIIQKENADFYRDHKLALLTVAANVLENHIGAATIAIAAPELADLPETELWREYLALYLPKPNAAQEAVERANAQTATAAAPQPAPAQGFTYNASEDQDSADQIPPVADEAAPKPPERPLMRFLKFNKSFIGFYPPRIRQKLAVVAADAYIENGLVEKALATFDTLNKDEILDPVRPYAEYALGLAAEKNKKPKEALAIFQRLAKQPYNPDVRARARFSEAMLLMNTEERTPEETADTLESIRVSWRGDALERKILRTLAELALQRKEYGDALRAMKTFVDEFPNDSDYLTVASEMAVLFEQLYLQGLADEMPPVKSLSLFYEFRDLTPIGEKGDAIIQKLADRLAAFDLIERAAQLLENQITYRIGGEQRSQVGARLALLYLLNHQPAEALRILETTNYGANPPDLQRQRLELSAQALNESGRHEDAMNILYNDHTPTGDLLKLDILWSAQDWPNMVNRAEDILSKRADLTAKLTPTETEVLLKLALGYSFEGDYNQLRYLRDYYSTLLDDNAYKQIFDFITNDTAPLDREDMTMLTQQISRTEGFMGAFKSKIAAGKLSEAIK